VGGRVVRCPSQSAGSGRRAPNASRPRCPLPIRPHSQVVISGPPLGTIGCERQFAATTGLARLASCGASEATHRRLTFHASHLALRTAHYPGSRPRDRPVEEERFRSPAAKALGNSRQLLECGDRAKRSHRFPSAPQGHRAWAGRCAPAKAPARAGALQTLRALERRTRPDRIAVSRCEARIAGWLAANVSSQLR